MKSHFRASFGLFASLAFFPFLIAACGSAATPAPTTRPDPTPGRYEQTWGKGYTQTFCDDWSKKMDAHQKFVAAVDLLSAAWKAAGVERQPPDVMASNFRAQLDTACADGGTEFAITDLGIGIYVMSGTEFAP